MKKYILILLINLFFIANLSANVTVYFNYNTFNSVNNLPYLETYITISGQSVKFLPVAKGKQASVTISWKILKGTETVKSSQYNLKSPLITDTLYLPSFIDNQRFFLENGTYTLELEVFDNAFPDKKTKHSETITINLKREQKIYSSEIQPLDSYSKTITQNLFSKNGYDLIPYTINYYPKNQNQLKFYFESYNLDSVIGKGSKFVYSYYIENSETATKQQSLLGFQKQNANIINPLLTQFDISQLPSGNFNLVIEIKDSVNNLKLQKKWFFQRQGSVKQNLDVYENSSNEITTVDQFFNTVQSQDSLKDFIESLWPRSSFKEREWQQIQVSKKDPTLMRNFLIEYWKATSADSIDPYLNFKKYYASVLETNAMMKCGKQKGYYTDRGRVYLQYGKPDQRNQVNSEPNTYPYEIWQYYRIYDKATGNFFTNKKFVFVNANIADDCYKLIHSDMRGELNDEKWRYRLVTRSQQNQNVDDTNPMKTYGNNVDENFLNPR